MTVEATATSKSYVYTGPGDYTFTFLAPLETDILVQHTDTLGVVATLTLGTDYTVTLASPGGTITSTYAPTTGYLNIQLNIPYTQPQEWENADSFDMSIIESAFDRAVLQIQQLRTIINDGVTTTVWRSWWTTATDYVVLNTVVNGSKYYQCIEDHTSGVLATDVAAGKWIVIADFTSVADLSAYATLASPVLTGVPEAPTAATGTDTDQLATTEFVQQELDALTYGPLAIQVFTSSGTYTKTAGATIAVVEVVGGGGGGAGYVRGSGGSGGGYAKKLISLAAVTTETVTVGVAGTGGAAGANGVAGGTSSFGAHCSATGGGRGVTGENISDIGGIGSGGDIDIRGGRGFNATYGGGDSMMGFGGNACAGAAVGYGAGGNGTQDTAGSSGSNGTAGIVIVTEY